jgi:predicted acyltransferase
MKPKTSAAQDKQQRKAPDKSVILILAGIIVTGIIAGYGWIRRLPKD